MSRVAAWNGEEWVDRIASETEKRERWRSGGRRWVNAEDVYGAAQVDQGWHALWELTEARCRCGAIEVVAWRPGHRNGKHGAALVRTQHVECWECGEVLDLRLERRDRQAEEDRHDAAIQEQLRVLHGEFRQLRKGQAGRWVPRKRWTSALGSRMVARGEAVVKREVTGERARQQAAQAAVDAGIKKAARADAIRRAEAAVDPSIRKASREEAIRRARAYQDGIRFVVGALAKLLQGADG